MAGDHVTFLRLKAIDAGDGERWIVGWATLAHEDRVGDVVVPGGAKYELPLPLLAHHDHAAPVGAVTEASVTSAGIRIRAKLTRGVEKADELWQLVRDGVMSLSIGFRALASTPLPSGGLRFDSWAWHELSIVSVPCCPGTSVQAVVGKSVAYATTAQPATKPPRLDENFRRAVEPQRSGETELQMHYRRFDACVELLPASIRTRADFRSAYTKGSTFVVQDEWGDVAASIDLKTGAVRIGDEPPPAPKAKSPAPKAQPAVTRKLLDDTVLRVCKSVGKAIGKVESELIERIEQLEAKLQDAEDKGFRYRGYWRDGQVARRGDAYSLDGNVWWAVRATRDKPMAESMDWMVAVRRGRDG